MQVDRNVNRWAPSMASKQGDEYAEIQYIDGHKDGGSPTKQENRNI